MTLREVLERIERLPNDQWSRRPVMTVYRDDLTRLQLDIEIALRREREERECSQKASA
jgi:hypothetical protein